MKIQGLSLKDFSSHRVTKLDFGRPVNVFVGALNAGKSSIAQALEIALTGSCELYRKRTDDLTDLVHRVDGTDDPDRRFQVSVTTDKGTAKRGRSSTSQFIGWNDAVGAEAEAAMLVSLNTKKAVLSALMNVSGFFELEPKEQKALLLGLIGAEVNDEEIRKHFDGEADALKLLPFDLSSISAIDNAYKHCFEERTGVNRDLRELKPMDPPTGEAPPAGAIDNIKKRIEELQAEKAKIIADRESRQEQLDKIRPVRESLLKEKAAIEAWQRANPKPVRSDIEKLKSDKENAKAALATARTQRDEAATAFNAAVADRLRYEANVQQLAHFKGICVAGDHPCPASIESMAAARKQQEAAMLDAAGREVSLKKRVAELTAICDDQSAIRHLEQSADSIRRLLEDHKIKAGRLEEVEASIAKLPSGGAESLAEWADDVTVPILEKKVAELDGRIKTGITRLEEAQAWIYRNAEVARVAAKRRDLEIKSRYLESLVTFLGPKGVKVTLIQRKIDAFQDLINKSLARFGFSFSFSVEPWQVYAKGRPINRLSTSERFRLGVAFQIAIAKITGLGVVVVDKAELLTADARGAMFKLLIEAELDFAIVIQTLMVPLETFKGSHPQHPAIDWFVVSNKDGVSEVQKL